MNESDPLRPKRSGTIQRYRPKGSGARVGSPRVTTSCAAAPQTGPGPSSTSTRARRVLRRRELLSARPSSSRRSFGHRGLAPFGSALVPRAFIENVHDNGTAWYEAWLEDRRRRGLVGHVQSDIKTYITPFIGKHPRDWTADDLRAFCRKLDELVQAGEISWKTAVNVWGTATRIAKDACRSKLDSLRVRDDNPALGVAGPDRGVKKSKQYLFPSEFLRFVSCEDVPLAWRRAVALAVYLYPRPAELRALSLLHDVDLEHGTVHIHHSLDGDGNAKPTKTKTPRRFSIEPALVPLLKAMVTAKGEHVPMPAAQQNLSAIFRRWLRVAGVDRAELHTTTATRKAITFYDARATGITWMAVRGDDPLKIMQRAGHSNFATTLGYIREAESVLEGFGDVFPPLPAALMVPNVTTGNVPPKPRRGRPPKRIEAPLLSRQLSQVAQVSGSTVRRRGLEPPRVLPHWNLNPGRSRRSHGAGPEVAFLSERREQYEPGEVVIAFGLQADREL